MEENQIKNIKTVGKQSGRKTEKWKQIAMKMEKTGNKGGKTEVGVPRLFYGGVGLS
jgi:hypothetical protein